MKKSIYDIIPKGNNWMHYIPDEIKASAISIPGTHDSGAFKGDPIAHTQEYNIREQLDKGIRFLDIRGRLINGVITIHHGAFYLDQILGDILNECYSFLEKNPTEFILFSLKKEHDTINPDNKSYCEVVKERYWDKDLWFVDDRIPKIKEIRGKIVLLRRFYSEDSFGLNLNNWKDNLTFELPLANVQDEYKVTNDIITSGCNEKIENVENFLEKYEGDIEKYNLNFCSGHMYLFDKVPVLGVKKISKKINPIISKYYDSKKNEKFNAVIIMDYPEEGEIKDIYWQSLLNHAKDEISKIDVHIKNKFRDEYLYAAIDGYEYDNDRRNVFTWDGTNTPTNSQFILELVNPKKIDEGCYIFNTGFSEYLYAANSEFSEDSHRRRVFTWKKGNKLKKGIWKIEENKDDNTFLILNVEYGEYLYAAGSPYKYTDQRRRVFTWGDGKSNLGPEGKWEISK